MESYNGREMGVYFCSNRTDVTEGGFDTNPTQRNRILQLKQNRLRTDKWIAFPIERSLITDRSVYEQKILP